jgi:hypothetical protein
MERSGIITSKSANIVGAKDRDKKIEFALVEEVIQGNGEGERVDRDTVGRSSDEERDRFGKGGIKSGLRIDKFKGSKIRRARGGRRSKDGSHTRREGRNGRSSSGGTENKSSELAFSEKGQAVGGVIGNDIRRGRGGKGGLFGIRKFQKIVFGDDRGLVGWFGRGGKLENFGNTSRRGSTSSGGGVGEESLRKAEPEFEWITRDRKARINRRGIEGRAESKIGDTRRALAEVGRDGLGDRSAIVVAKAKGVEIVDRKESGASKATNGGGFESGVVRAARDMAKGRNEFGRTVERSMFDK